MLPYYQCINNHEIFEGTENVVPYRRVSLSRGCALARLDGEEFVLLYKRSSIGPAAYTSNFTIRNHQTHNSYFSTLKMGKFKENLVLLVALTAFVSGTYGRYIYGGISS